MNVFQKPDRKIVIGVSLCILSLLYLANHIWGFFGHYGGDDMTYAGLANALLQKKLVLANDHANYRWVVIFLTALSYKIFGISDHSSAIMPMLFTLTTALLVAKCITNKWQAALAIFLFGLQSWIIFYADKIMPDIYVAFFYMAAIYIIYLQKLNNRERSYTYGVLLALMLFLATLAKETIVLSIPVFAYLLIADVLQKRNIRFWATTIIFLIFIMALYLLFIKVETGHFLQRYYAIKAQSYFNPCSYDLLPISETYRRITSGLMKLFIRSGLFWMIGFAFIPLTHRPFKSLIKVSTTEDLFATVFILTLLCCNFMSTSPTHYIPMCEDARHYLFLIPITAIVGSNGILIFFKEARKYFWLIILFALTLYIALDQNYENRYDTYIPLVIVTVLAFCTDMFLREKINRFAYFLFFITMSLIISAQPIDSFVYARLMGYRFQKRLFMKDIRNRPDKILVISNHVERNYGPYYMAYDTSHIIFRSYEDVKNDSIPADYKIFLLNDGFTGTIGNMRWEDMPKYARETKNYKEVDNIGGTTLYELNRSDLKE